MTVGHRAVLAWVGRSAKRIAVAVVGVVLVLAGLAMLVLPGPGFIVALAGLAVLATEFAWARSALDTTKRRGADVGRALRSRRRS